MVRIKAEAKSQGLKEAFARIDRQDRWWKLTKKIKGFFAGAFGFMTFLVWLALIFGSLGAVYYFRAPIWNYFAKTVNEMQAKSAAEKAGEKAAERPAP
jgi:hypothetical protein